MSNWSFLTLVDTASQWAFRLECALKTDLPRPTLIFSSYEHTLHFTDRMSNLTKTLNLQICLYHRVFCFCTSMTKKSASKLCKNVRECHKKGMKPSFQRILKDTDRKTVKEKREECNYSMCVKREDWSQKKMWINQVVRVTTSEYPTCRCAVLLRQLPINSTPFIW